MGDDPIQQNPDQGDHTKVLTDLGLKWDFIAGIAWVSFTRMGPGVVVVTVLQDGSLDIEYGGGSDPCDPHADLMREYDPERQVVLAVVRDGEEHVYVLDGSPPPPEAFENDKDKILNAEEVD